MTRKTVLTTLLTATILASSGFATEPMEQQAGPNHILAMGTALPHIAFGGTEWKTTFIFTNTNAVNAKTVLLAFYDDNGIPLPVPINGQLVTTFIVTVAPNGTTFLETSDAPAIAPATGWCGLIVDGSSNLNNMLDFGAMAIFRQRVPGRPEYEATVSAELTDANNQLGTPYVLPYDQTNGYGSG